MSAFSYSHLNAVDGDFDVYFSSLRFFIPNLGIIIQVECHCSFSNAVLGLCNKPESQKINNTQHLICVHVCCNEQR